MRACALSVLFLQQTRVHIIVHDLKPPFLDGRVVYTKQLQTVVPIRDPSSDLAKFCRKGSNLVSEKRKQREQRKVSGCTSPRTLTKVWRSSCCCARRKSGAGRAHRRRASTGRWPERRWATCSGSRAPTTTVGIALHPVHAMCTHPAGCALTSARCLLPCAVQPNRRRWSRTGRSW